LPANRSNVICYGCIENGSRGCRRRYRLHADNLPAVIDFLNVERYLLITGLQVGLHLKGITIQPFGAGKIVSGYTVHACGSIMCPFSQVKICHL
jgi:hypothetical protein